MEALNGMTLQETLFDETAEFQVEDLDDYLLDAGNEANKPA